MPGSPTSRSRAALAQTLALALVLGACKNDDEQPARERSQPLTAEQVPSASLDDVREVEARSYARSLAEQLDLVPTDASYLVVRDLRPILEQARVIERVLAGPITRALQGESLLGTPIDPTTRTAVEDSALTLSLALAGLESAGIELERGLVAFELAGSPVVIFSAADLASLATLASLTGDPSLKIAERCTKLAEPTSAWACSLGDPKVLEGYQPGKQGAARVAALQQELPGVALEQINVAVAFAGPPSQSLVLRTDPGLWELSLAMPSAGAGPQEQVLAAGPTPSLRALVPATGFVWLRFDVEKLLAGPQQMALAGTGLTPELLTGELFLGVFDQPSAMIGALGITDAGNAAKIVQQLGQMLPAGPIDTKLLPGSKLAIDRSAIDLDGKLVPALGFELRGESSEQLAKTLGVPTKLRVWAYGDYLSAGLGDHAELPAALGRLRGEGPSPTAIANLPPTLARALLAREVGVAVHVVLDHWQAPLNEDELAELFAELPQAERPDSSAIAELFAALAPWSSLSVWLQRSSETGPWVAQLSVVPFAGPGPGISDAEVELAQSAIEAALTGGDAQAIYGQLLERFPASPRSPSYRARAGQAPDHHAMFGLMQLGLFATLGMPAMQQYMQKARAQEAVGSTQAILAAATAVHEREGSCAKLLGKAGPTPPLSLACGLGPGGRCEPVSGGSSEPGRYDAGVWKSDPLWSTIGWAPEDGHRFHYEFEASGDASSCTLKVRARGDLDGDGQLSTYTRSTTIAADGSQQSPGLQVENEGE